MHTHTDGDAAVSRGVCAIAIVNNMLPSLDLYACGFFRLNKQNTEKNESFSMALPIFSSKMKTIWLVLD